MYSGSGYEPTTDLIAVENGDVHLHTRPVPPQGGGFARVQSHPLSHRLTKHVVILETGK